MPAKQRPFHIRYHRIFIANYAGKSWFFLFQFADEVLAYFFFNAFGFITAFLQLAECFYILDIHLV